MLSLTCQIYTTLKSVTETQWLQLFQDYPLPPQAIWLMEEAGIEAYEMYSLVIREQGEPILYLPLFITQFPLDIESLPETHRKYINLLGKIRASWVNPKSLVIGFLEACNSAVGIAPDLSEERQNQAWQLVFKELERFARQKQARMLVFFDFPESELKKLPPLQRQGFGCWKGIPTAQMNIEFENAEQYIATLSKKTRSNLRQKFRKSDPISIIYTRRPQQWLDQIYEMYLSVAENAEWEMGIQNYEFFECICEQVPEAQYVLYFNENKSRLIAFALNFTFPSCLTYLYFGMDAKVGKQYNMFFRIWLENVRYCIENNIPHYYSGNTLEHQKRRLGATLIPSYIFYKHLSPIGHWLFKRYEDALSYQSVDPLLHTT